MSNRTVFIDTSLSNYETLAAQYDASLFNIVYLTDPRTGYLQIQEYLTTNNISTADINVVSASSSLSGLFTGRVVFVDPSATDYQTLIAGMDAGATVVVLDANSDGVQQIHDYLANNAGLVSAVDIITGGGLSSLDVVSHGDAGALYLGSTVLTSDNMNQYTDLLADIGNQLTDNGDILLYGCDVAAGDIGQQFINQLADATGADVAASTDLTGATALGGDWVLEANTGSIETITLSDPDYNALLAALPAPSISSITDDALPSTGSLTDGSSTNDTTPTIRVNLSGTGAQAGDTVKLYDDTTSLGSAVSLTSLDISNAYKDITTAVLTNGAYNFRATWWNGSTESNKSTNNAWNITIDTTSPNIPSISSITDDALPSTGSLTDGSSTNDTTPTIRVNLTGTNAIAGDAVQLYDSTAPIGSTITLGANDITHNYIDITTSSLSAGTYNFRVAVIDKAGNISVLSTDNAWNITISSGNVAPVLDSTKSPVGAAVLEDAATPTGAVGTLVSALVDFTGGGGNDNVSDVDASAVTGIAVTGADTINGDWYYSTDNGTTWSSLVAVTDSTARLLAPDARLYFKPNANYDGDANVTFRAWDQTSGSNGAVANTTINGGTTAFSTATDTANFDVTPVNDAPTIDVTANAFTEDNGSAVADAVAGTFTTNDEEGDTLTVTFTGTSNDDGYYALGTGADEGKVLLTTAGAAWVNSGHLLPAINLTVTDDGSPNKTGSDSATPDVTLVNDAPTIDVTANAFTEDNGSAVADAVAGTFTTNDEEGDTLTVTFTGTSNDDGYYALGTGADEGKVLLTTAGAAWVNSGHLLPAINLTVTDDGSPNKTGSDSATPDVTLVNDAPTTPDFTLSTIENAPLLVPIIPDYASDEESNAITLISTTKVTFTPGQKVINPITLKEVSLDGLFGQATISSDGKLLSISLPTELDWMKTNDRIDAVLSYTVTETLNASAQNTGTINLEIFGSTSDKGKVLSLSNGSDTSWGTNDEDVIKGNNGNDTLYGWWKNPNLSLSNNIDPNLNLLDKTDALYGGNGNDWLWGGYGIDYLFGENGKDELHGGADNDVLFGGNDLDVLYGEAGNDILYGGHGNDVLNGGAGNDTYVFENGFGTDLITGGFSVGDRLVFSDIFDAGMTASDFYNAGFVAHNGIGDGDVVIQINDNSVTLVGVDSIMVDAVSFVAPL